MATRPRSEQAEVRQERAEESNNSGRGNSQCKGPSENTPGFVSNQAAVAEEGSGKACGEVRETGGAGSGFCLPVMGAVVDRRMAPKDVCVPSSEPWVCYEGTHCRCG